MRYFVFTDDFSLLSVIGRLADSSDEMVVITIGERRRDEKRRMPGRLIEWEEPTAKKISNLDIKSVDRVILSTTDSAFYKKIVGAFSGFAPSPPILVITNNGQFHVDIAGPNVSNVDLGYLAKKQIDGEWKVIEARRKAFELYDILAGGENVMILTQNDPDPDAIASAMAIQELIKKTGQTAQICTFGKVARHENIAMMRLLKIKVRTITQEQMKEFDRVVIVDAQPPYFKDKHLGRVDAVIDHHPYPGNYEAAFKDLNVYYGATATMLYEYLYATGTKISMRLATALLYGVITDTMYLARDTSWSDFEAFSALWPVANIGTIATMSRPRLNPEELSYFVRAINNRKVVGDLVFIWLGHIKREDIIPRLADFSLQIGESVWSVVGGEHEGDLVVSVRNMGADRDAGMVLRSLFGKLGGAGGHHSMAKAVIPYKKFKSHMGLKTGKEVGEKLFSLFENALYLEG